MPFERPQLLHAERSGGAIKENCLGALVVTRKSKVLHLQRITVGGIRIIILHGRNLVAIDDVIKRPAAAPARIQLQRDVRRIARHIDRAPVIFLRAILDIRRGIMTPEIETVTAKIIRRRDYTTRRRVATHLVGVVDPAVILTIRIRLRRHWAGDQRLLAPITLQNAEPFPALPSAAVEIVAV